MRGAGEGGGEAGGGGELQPLQAWSVPSQLAGDGGWQTHRQSGEGWSGVPTSPTWPPSLNPRDRGSSPGGVKPRGQNQSPW